MKSCGRTNTIEALRDLSSGRQAKLWEQSDPKTEWIFDVSIHILLDDFPSLEFGYDYVGTTELDIFVDNDEADAVMSLCALLLELVKKLGDRRANEFVGLPEWPEVQCRARQALLLMEKNDLAHP